MKILFIWPCIGSIQKSDTGIAYLSAYLKEHHHKVDLIELTSLKTKPIFNKINYFKPDLIAFNSNSHQFHYVKGLSAKIKEVFDIKIVVGGAHPTGDPWCIKESPFIDGICIGEGEYALLELVENLDKKNIKNFWFRDNNKIIKNPVRPLIQNLDELPFPDKLIFNYYKKNKKVIPRFIFSRGCPFNCTYCSNATIKKHYPNQQYVRFRSVDKCLDEIGLLQETHKFDTFWADDDIFTINKKWLREFCEKYPKRFDKNFECHLRVGAVNKEDLELLKKAGCSLVRIGLESGSERIRRDILNRHMSNQQIIDTFKMAKEVGIKTYSFNMVGIPHETMEDIKQTIELNRKIKPDKMQCTIFYPYIGTHLGKYCKEKGWINGLEDDWFKDCILNLPTLSKSKIRRARKNFEFNVYKKDNIKKAILCRLKNTDIIFKLLYNQRINDIIGGLYRKLFV